MKTNFTKKIIMTVFALCTWALVHTYSQACEWQLVLQSYSDVDPDGAGPATGSASFTLQLRSTSVNIPDVGVITTGFSYQSAAAMVPTNPGCATVSSPANITVSPEFAAAGFVYETVFQCNAVDFPAGTEIYNRTAAGSLSSNLAGGITLTNQFKDVFTVTLWTLGAGFPQGGYVMIRSGAGVPGGLGTYGVFDNVGGDFPTTSLTYTTGLALGGSLPVLFTNFDAKCSSNGTLISWATAQEDNSSSFEIERSTNGTSWSKIGAVPASGTSSVSRNYQQIDLIGGAAFYRIKQLDKNGQFMYSDIARTNCQVKNISSVIYPVPAHDVLNVVIKSDKAVRTQLMVYDMQGKLVKKLDANVLNGNNNFRINLLGLPSGDYMLRSNDAVLELNKIFTISR
ncbi:MAG: T9SS type A sorting domain-containing protein [Chitinophagaceae bacterium]|nr:MAG: T9SS type A sorting domain-containing protein [Chitinophagaceae bacterium]